jgi:hypothetical protein
MVRQYFKGMVPPQISISRRENFTRSGKITRVAASVCANQMKLNLTIREMEDRAGMAIQSKQRER